MNRRQRAKQEKRHMELIEAKETLKALEAVKQELERGGLALNMFVNQQRTILHAYEDLLRPFFKWKAWKDERPTAPGLYLVYGPYMAGARYGLIRIMPGNPAIYDQFGSYKASEAHIRYWRPLAEVANWQKEEVKKEVRR